MGNREDEASGGGNAEGVARGWIGTVGGAGGDARGDGAGGGIGGWPEGGMEA